MGFALGLHDYSNYDKMHPKGVICAIIIVVSLKIVLWTLLSPTSSTHVDITVSCQPSGVHNLDAFVGE